MKFLLLGKLTSIGGDDRNLEVGSSFSVERCSHANVSGIATCLKQLAFQSSGCQSIIHHRVYSAIRVGSLYLKSKKIN